MLYTTRDLITGVQSKAMMPTSQTTFTDTDILKLADEKIKSLIVPVVLSTREDYYLTYVDYATPANSYSIPYDAIGMKVSRVAFVDSDGTEWPAIRVANVTETYEANDRFFIQKNTIYFDQQPTKTIRVYYHIRPLTLTVTTQAMQIVSINGLDIVVNSVPSSIVATTAINGIDAKPGYETLMPSNVISSINTTTLTMTDVLPASLSVGDWLSAVGYTAVPQIPCEMQVALEWSVAAAITKSLGDAQGSALCAQEAQSAIKDALSLLQPRVDGQSKKIVNKDSLLRQSSDYFNFGVWVR